MKIVINLKSKKKDVSTWTNLETKKSSWLSLLHGTLLGAWHWTNNTCSVTTEGWLSWAALLLCPRKAHQTSKEQFGCEAEKRNSMNSFSHHRRPLETQCPYQDTENEQSGSWECLCLHVGMITKVKFFIFCLLSVSYSDQTHCLGGGASVTHSRLIY